MSIATLAYPPRIRGRTGLSRRGLAGLLRFVFVLTGWVARELRVRRDMRKLAEFDDFMLRDIGIARTDLEGSVRNGRDRP
jgi:uncharacterized protein YjiS (DUF1127 family)